MKVFLTRHGRTNYNDLGLCNSDPSVDVHLTPVGIKQAEALAARLKNERFDRIFISELKRTRQTAEIVGKFHDVKVEVDARLNDGRTGFEGKSSEEFNKALNAAADRWTARFNGGESIEDVRTRVASFIDTLRARNYDAVLVVTSEWIVQSFVALARNLSNDEMEKLRVEQGSCTVVEI